MPPAEPIAERIYQDIESTLQAMTAGADYFTTLGKVTRGDLSPLEGFGLPFASVLPGNDRAEYGAQVKRREMAFTVRVWIDADPARAATTLQRLIGDIQKVLAVDQRRAGLAEVTLEQDYDPLYLVDDARLAGADIHWLIHYRTDIFDPAQGV